MRVARFALLLRAGQVYVNAAAFQPEAPFGGYKQSGVGREPGRYELDELLQTKATVREPLRAQPAASARVISAAQ